MAVKGWFDLTPEKQREAFLNLRHHDIGEYKLTLTVLTNLLTRYNLLGDLEIRQHFKNEKISLPSVVTKETEN
jgi:hypothetical protein